MEQSINCRVLKDGKKNLPGLRSLNCVTGVRMWDAT